MASRFVISSLVAVLLCANLSGEERTRDRERTVNESTWATERAPFRIEALAALSPEAVPGPALGDQSRASLAGDDGEIVAVWEDARGISASRIGQDGALLDPFALVVGQGKQPQIAWNGEAYLVAWFAPSPEARIECVLLDRELRILRRITSPSLRLEAFYTEWLRVASNGSGFLIARRQQELQGQNGIHTNIVSADGVVSERQLLATTSFTGDIDVASDGIDYYVAWTVALERVVEVARVRGSDGVGLWRKVVRRASEYTSGVAIAWTGDLLSLAWIEGTSYYAVGRLLYTRTAPGLDGSLPVSEPRVLVDTRTARQPDIATNRAGTELVVWSTDVPPGASTDLRGLILRNGRPDADSVSLSAAPFSQDGASTIWGGSQFVVSWRDGRLDEDKSRDLRYALLTSPSLEITTEQVMATTARSQTASALAGGTSTFLALWEESTSDRHRRIVATLLDANGIPRKTLAVSPSSGDQTSASVSFRAGHYLVVWAEQTAIDHWAIFGRRFDEGGVAVDATPLEVADTCCRPDSTAVAASRERWLVLWSVQQGQYGDFQAFGSFVADASIIPLNDGHPLSLSENLESQFELAAASDGEGFLVAWQEGDSWAGCQVTCLPSQFAIRTLRVDGDGTVGHSAEVARGLQLSPALAWNGSEYLLVWLDHRSSTWTELTGLRIRDGIAGSAFLVERGTTDQFRPRVVATVDGWLVVWETIAGYPEDCPDSCQWAAFGKLLPFTGGTPGETNRLYVEDSLQVYTAVAAMTDFRPMMILSRDVAEAPYGALRVFSGRFGDAVRRRPARR